jgi:hypothetical protein
VPAGQRILGSQNEGNRGQAIRTASGFESLREPSRWRVGVPPGCETDGGRRAARGSRTNGPAAGPTPPARTPAEPAGLRSHGLGQRDENGGERHGRGRDDGRPRPRLVEEAARGLLDQAESVFKTRHSPVVRVRDTASLENRRELETEPQCHRALRRSRCKVATPAPQRRPVDEIPPPPSATGRCCPCKQEAHLSYWYHSCLLALASALSPLGQQAVGPGVGLPARTIKRTRARFPAGLPASVARC